MIRPSRNLYVEAFLKALPTEVPRPSVWWNEEDGMAGWTIEWYDDLTRAILSVSLENRQFDYAGLVPSLGPVPDSKSVKRTIHGTFSVTDEIPGEVVEWLMVHHVRHSNVYPF